MLMIKFRSLYIFMKNYAYVNVNVKLLRINLSNLSKQLFI
jgi:hypothetical protein